LISTSIQEVCLFLALSLLLLSGLLEHTLNDLLFLNEEGTDDSLLDTAGADVTTVGTLDGLVWLGNVGVFTWSQAGNTWKSNTAVTALWSRGILLDVQVSEVTTWGLDDLDLVRSGVVYSKR
jgi:hypothetical protein